MKTIVPLAGDMVVAMAVISWLSVNQDFAPSALASGNDSFAEEPAVEDTSPCGCLGTRVGNVSREETTTDASLAPHAAVAQSSGGFDFLIPSSMSLPVFDRAVVTGKPVEQIDASHCGLLKTVISCFFAKARRR